MTNTYINTYRKKQRRPEYLTDDITSVARRDVSEYHSTRSPAPELEALENLPRAELTAAMNAHRPGDTSADHWLVDHFRNESAPMKAIDAPAPRTDATSVHPGQTMPYLVLGLFGLYTLEFGVVGALPIITDRFDVSVSRAGLLMAMFALIVAVTGPFSVLLTSRLDRRLVLVGAQTVFALCSALSAFAPSFEVLMALRVVPALLHPVFFAAAFTAATSLYPKDKQAHATSTAIIGTTLGLVVGVPATAWFGAQFSYEVSFLFCTAVTLAAAVGLLVKLPRTARTAPMSFGHQVSILRNVAVWLNILATVLTLAAMFAVYSYAAEYLESETGLDGKTVSLILLIGSAARSGDSLT
jgi:predicted MFS family arabinose efflux permease